jgi:hypothetical protein
LSITEILERDKGNSPFIGETEDGVSRAKFHRQFGDLGIGHFGSQTAEENGVEWGIR